MLKKHQWLIIILCLAALVRIPSLFEPYWYGDEAIYLTIGQALRSGVSLYSGIHDNKPPFLYLIAALAGGNQFWFKFIALIWALLTITVFYKLVNKIFDRQKWAYLATGLFAFLLCWPKLEGNIANAELFFLLPTLYAACLLWTKPAGKTILAAGISLGLASLFKIPAVFEAGVWPVVWLFGKEKGWWKKTMILGMGVMIPICISAICFLEAGSGEQFFRAAWSQNLPYLSTWKSSDGPTGIFSLTGRGIAVILWVAGVLWLSKKDDVRFRILGIWAMLAWFAALLSGRPYPHYLLQAAGVTAILGVVIAAGNNREKSLAITLSVIFLATITLFKFYNYPVVDYYQNFAGWVGKQKSQEEYFAWFDSRVNSNYEIAQIVRSGSRPGDKIFVWGDEPAIYALAKRLPTGKYTVKYHIKDFKAESETLTSLYEEMPKYIVSFGREEELPGLANLIAERYLYQKKTGSAQIYRFNN